MFLTIGRFILRNRIVLLIVLLGITVLLGWRAIGIELQYDMAQVLPASDPYYKEYNAFKQRFGDDGSVMVIGLQDSQFFSVQKFNEWFSLGQEIKKIDGIEAVVSAAQLYTILKDDSARKFVLKPVMTRLLSSQAELDSIRNTIYSLPFYDGFIINKETGATLMAITFEKQKLKTKNRIAMVDSIEHKAKSFASKHNLEVHFSGLPYIRTATTRLVVDEMKLFMILAIIVTSLILLFFFRSVVVVFFSMVVVMIGVVWALGIMALLGYKISLLSGLIPPLIVIIGVPNTILLLNKYHSEFRDHGNKIKSLARMVHRIGFTTLLANLNTAIAFGVFYFTRSRLLMEFGLVAALNILATWLITLIIIPIVFSFLPEPKVRHTKHLEAKRMSGLLEWVNRVVHHHYRIVYAVVIAAVIISVYGMTKISAVGFVVDDLPKKHPVYVDLKFFEKHFSGVLPLEISIDTKKENGALSTSNLQKINRLEKMLHGYDELSRPLAIVDGIKFAYQSYNGGDRKYYVLPGSLQLAEMADFIGDAQGKDQIFRSFIDSSKRFTRVSVQVADIGSQRIKGLTDTLKLRVDSVFKPDAYQTSVTGNSLIFLRGNNYLLTHLFESILLAVFFITIIMVMLFMSARMIAISILPSLIPQVVTAGLMGFFQVPLKPSTILIFSIAFGIASDQTIYFLTKYRQELKANPLSISRAVSASIRETGFSMIYAAIILFSGFFIFTASQFGGTASLGKLISLTLLMAMLSNLFLLPAFLITLERRLVTKAFLHEPMIQIFDEEEDIDLDELKIKETVSENGKDVSKENENITG